MMFLDRGIARGVCVMALLWGAPVLAQENLYSNKTPAQIFASDCSICHKTPQGLSKAGGPLGLGLEGFLREHYTASRETAAVMAKYVQSMDTGPAPAEKKRGTGAKPAGAKKPADAKAGDAKAPNGKPSDKKAEPAGETKTEAKPAESKPAEKPAEPKPAEAAKPEKSE
jgi:hypothetical protein